MEPVLDQRIFSGRYQITHLIARGGMAIVYRAQDQLLNRSVALKVLYPELSNDPTFVERFRREAQAAANLSHPNIVPVFDWGEERGTYFIVMELIDGVSLAGKLHDVGTLSPTESVRITAAVASALSYAHRTGVVHRDVKPGNILLTADGQVKVTDFGIAQAISTHDNLTQAGSVMGTATYFSPEQAEGHAVDGRSDVYSLGVVLYEMLTGRPPFVGDSPVAVASMHVRQALTPARSINPAIPSDLDAIVTKALAKRLPERYPTADDLRSDLLRYAQGEPIVPRGRGGYVDDATRSVSAVTGERTQAVPVMSGPRTDVRSRRRGLNPLWFAAVAVIVIVAAVGGYMAFKPSSVSRMPNVVGETITSATGTITGDGLVVGSTNLVASSEPSGTVVSTKPAAGEHVTPGQAVTLNVSLGQSSTPVTIPNVVGTDLSTAESTLSGDKLSVKIEFTSTAPAGSLPNVVLNQTPPGGSSGHTGDQVILQVLSPNSMYPVPDIANQTQLQAAAILGQASLTVGAAPTQACSNNVPSGNVVGTTPAIGTPVKSGSTINFIVSTGYCNVVVPSVIGLTMAGATATLQAQGLIGNFVTVTMGCSSYNDYVLTQNQQAPGSSLPYGSAVTVGYCPGH
jgi:serine/threonine-protein kinase